MQSKSHDSYKKLKISTLVGVWKKMIPTFISDFGGFNNSIEDVTADVVQIAQEQGLYLEPEDVTERPQSSDKA